MKRFSMFVCAAALMATGAYAGGMMTKFDANKDGKITTQEADAATAAKFTAMDLNKDGFIDASEAQKAKKEKWEKFKERRADMKAEDSMPEGGKGMRGHRGHGGPGGPGMFEDADTNKDGKITKAEFLAASDGRFEDMDFDKNGVIEKSDFEAHRAACEAGKILCGPLARLDENKDGKVSKAEFMSKPRPMFERMDANKDGVIDQAEMAAGKKAHMHGADGPPPPAQ